MEDKKITPIKKTNEIIQIIKYSKLLRAWILSTEDEKADFAEKLWDYFKKKEN